MRVAGYGKREESGRAGLRAVRLTLRDRVRTADGLRPIGPPPDGVPEPAARRTVLSVAPPHSEPRATLPVSDARVSVIVAAYNAATVLPRCLDALFSQDYKDFEVIVVDDGSGDDTVAVASQWLGTGRLKVVRSPLNRGISATRNLGIEAATGEILAFIDADGYAASDWVSEIVRAFDDPSVGVVASTVFLADAPLTLNGAGGMMNRAGWAGDIAGGYDYWSAELVRDVVYAMGCGMAVRRETAAQLAPFDAHIRYSYDDTDYGIRVWRAGWRVVLADRAWIDHGHGQTAYDSPHKAFLCERHRVRVVLKHWPIGELPRWLWHEARAFRTASSYRRTLKLAAIRWNLRRLPELVSARWRLRGALRLPASLVVPSYAEGVETRSLPAPCSPRPAEACDAVRIDAPAHDAALLWGWYDIERDDGAPYRWSARHAAVYLRIVEPAHAVHLRYRVSPWPVGAVTIALYETERFTIAWTLTLPESPEVWRDERYAAELSSGEYILVFAAPEARAHPPVDGRPLVVGLREVSIA